MSDNEHQDDSKGKTIMSDELLSLHNLIKQDIADDERCRNDPPPDEFNKGSRRGYRIALDYVEHEIRMLIEQRNEKPRPMGATKDFYCGRCFSPQYAIQCHMEDGAIIGHCPNCNSRRVFIHKSPSQKESEQS